MGVCISCGNTNVEHARFCQVCGTPIPETVPPVPQPAVYAVSARYAGFWIRFVAFTEKKQAVHDMLAGTVAIRM